MSGSEVAITDAMMYGQGKGTSSITELRKIAKQVADSTGATKVTSAAIERWAQARESPSEWSLSFRKDEMCNIRMAYWHEEASA